MRMLCTQTITKYLLRQKAIPITHDTEVRSKTAALENLCRVTADQHGLACERKKASGVANRMRIYNHFSSYHL